MLTREDLQEILKNLSEKRPIFHSEADFQHSLAWEIHLKYKYANIRLERKVDIDEEVFYIDIFIFNGGKTSILETKYKTAQLIVNHLNEDYHLRDQIARDWGRYGFCKDIERLEKILKHHSKWEGFAILLTNDKNYWESSNRNNTIDRDFRIHEGRRIRGTLRWQGNPAPGTIRGMEGPINLSGEYELQWEHYSNFHNTQNGEFRYLLVEIKRE